ncbi:MAG: DNA polymerase II large subunit [Candidatus Heimdallarchaeaceae archaeon]
MVDQITQNNNLSISIQSYFDSLNKQLKKIYNIATKARKQGLDPAPEVEIPIAKDIADRVEGLIGPEGIGKIIREYEKKNLSREKVAFKIAEDICQGKLIQGSKEQLADQAIRSSLAVITESITAAPIEGIAKVKIKNNYDGSEYLAIYYAGPIRSAGGTAAGMSVLLADSIRKNLGLAKYEADQREVERYLEELELYNRVSHLQLPTTKEEQRFAAQNLTIEITGEPTDKVEVSGNRDLARIETNRLRGGACLVFNDGLVGRSKKIYRRVIENQLEGWDWFKELIKIHEQAGHAINDDAIQDQLIDEEDFEVLSDEGYIKDVIAGRPVFAHPSEIGGFRIRYGRARTTGLAGMGIHPALMGVVNDFLACGTHVRTERPGKGAIVMPVDTIHPPIVKLNNGDVLKVQTYEEAKEIRKNISEVLFLGDMLYGVGEFNQNSYDLIPAGYCEEWWSQQLEVQYMETNAKDKDLLTKDLNRRIQLFIKNPYLNIPTPDEAHALSKILNIPLHPEYTFHWSNIPVDDYIILRDFVAEKSSKTPEGLEIPFDDKIKGILEWIYIPHKVRENKIQFDIYGTPLLISLGIHNGKLQQIKNSNGKILDLINSLSKIEIRNKCQTYTGARMGRPEKAKDRRMKPPVHLLFPVEGAGERFRDLYKASENKTINLDLANRHCPKCGKLMNASLCVPCNEPTVFAYKCTYCKLKLDKDVCHKCGRNASAAGQTDFPIGDRVKEAKRVIGGVLPKKVKAVKKLMNRHKVPELIEKGILRAKHGIFVYRDGTSRFDSTDAVLTHFKPNEVGVSIQQLHKNGYMTDVDGKPLENEDQLVELKIQDVIVNEAGGKHLLNVANFIDELLEKVYNLPPYYKAKKPEDLIGRIILGLAPHTSAGITGRIIGYTKAKVNFAHPYWHAAKRRNCDGDEDSIILALDAFLNFSRFYLPEIRGGKMDAPLILVANLNPHEVDDESHNVDTCSKYPLSFYEATLSRTSPKAVLPVIDMISNRLDNQTAYEGFYYTHNTSSIFDGPESTAYKNLETMLDKVEAQLQVANIIRSVDVKDVANRIIVNHFIPDLIGNMRRFGAQKFRCTKCNRTYRRIPLNEVCPNCKMPNLNLTVHEKSVIKYLEMAENLVNKYELSEYLRNRLALIKHNAETLFEGGATPISKKTSSKKVEGMVKLSDFFVKADDDNDKTLNK